MTLCAAADIDGDSDTFGLGAVLVCHGTSRLHSILLVPDDITPTARAKVKRWARRHPAPTATGLRPWLVVTLSEFFDPEATIEGGQPWAFVPRALHGGQPGNRLRLWTLLGLVAEHTGRRTGKKRDEWKIWPPGWGTNDGKECGRSRPIVRCFIYRPGAGWTVQFGFPKPGCGKMVGDHYWRGDFVDVHSAAYAFDADRGADFADHCRHFGLTPAELPLGVRVDGGGAKQVALSVERVLT